jgi:hypothetical protein
MPVLHLRRFQCDEKPSLHSFIITIRFVAVLTLIRSIPGAAVALSCFRTDLLAPP